MGRPHQTHRPRQSRGPLVPPAGCRFAPTPGSGCFSGRCVPRPGTIPRLAHRVVVPPGLALIAVPELRKRRLRRRIGLRVARTRRQPTQLHPVQQPVSARQAALNRKLLFQYSLRVDPANPPPPPPPQPGASDNPVLEPRTRRGVDPWLSTRGCRPGAVDPGLSTRGCRPGAVDPAGLSTRGGRPGAVAPRGCRPGAVDPGLSTGAVDPGLSTRGCRPGAVDPGLSTRARPVTQSLEAILFVAVMPLVGRRPAQPSQPRPFLVLHPLEHVRDQQNPLAHTPALPSRQAPQLRRPRFAAKEIYRHRPSPRHGMLPKSLYHIWGSPEAGIRGSCEYQATTRRTLRPSQRARR